MNIKKKLINNLTILAGYRGSIAHGMYVPSNNPNSTDDKDVMVITVPPIDYYFGLKTFGSKGTKEVKEGEWDIVIYEARKFIHLLRKGNPNVLSLLWLDQTHYLKVSPAGKILLDNRDLFVGRHVYHSFTGYAYSQLNKMEKYNQSGYMGEKRKKLVEKYGYDTKNAAHLIRLLRMGAEFLKDGQLYVQREDAPQLLDIKMGKWSLERVKEEAEKGFEFAKTAYLQSKLPLKPDDDKINELTVRVIKTGLEQIKES